jgi:hypothetical protein
MNISDLRTRIESSEKSSLLTKRTEPDEPPVLTLVDSAEPSAAREMPDPLIQALVDKLPKPNSVWSTGDRAEWLRAAAIIFNLIYKSAEADRGDLKGEEGSSVLKSAG